MPNNGLKLANSMLDFDFYKNSIKPSLFELKKSDRILIIAPHQDDESIGCGGLMIEAKKLGLPIEIILFTDGGQIIKGIPTEKLIQDRNDELLAVAKSVGAKVRFLNVNNFTLEVKKEHVVGLVGIIKKFEPTILATPWLMDFPLKHRAVNHVVAHCLSFFKTKELGFKMYGYQVHNNIVGNFYLDISHTIKEKVDLIKNHKSQLENFKKYDFLSEQMAGWNSRLINNDNKNEPVKYIEMFSVIEPFEYMLFVEKYYELNYKDTYFGDENVIKSIKLVKKIKSI